MSPRVLVYDIESIPAEVYRWSLWDKSPVALNMMKTPGRMVCFAAKWHGDKRTLWHSEYGDGGHEGMVRAAHALFDEADVLVSFNGKKYDTPRVQGAFAQYGLKPPSPFRQVDLYQTVARQFHFQSNRLAYVAQFLGLPEQKGSNEGFGLWVKWMAGDPKAIRAMSKYNRQDVVTTEALYDRLLPWINSHPHVGLYQMDPAEELSCGRCGAIELERRGYAVTQLGRYARLQCKQCGAWSRSKKAVRYADERPVS